MPDTIDNTCQDCHGVNHHHQGRAFLSYDPRRKLWLCKTCRNPSIQEP